MWLRIIGVLLSVILIGALAYNGPNQGPRSRRAPSPQYGGSRGGGRALNNGVYRGFYSNGYNPYQHIGKYPNWAGEYVNANYRG